MEKYKIGIVTPLRNELNNIRALFDSIESQSINIYYWVIVENDSSDGSIELLDSLKKRVKNVDNIQVLNIKSDNKKYELGVKYASIVKTGFDFLVSNEIVNDLDFIGIQDADCFPENSYYQKLSERMTADSRIGIASGLMYHSDGTRDIASKDWVLGGCRIWSKKCFLEAGYHIVTSADTISVCKAILKGWETRAFDDLRVVSREMGSNVNYAYYGYSWYFRGHTMLFGVLVTIKLILNGKLKWAREFTIGFFGNALNGTPRIDDKDVLNFYSNHLSRKVKNLFSIEQSKSK